MVYYFVIEENISKVKALIGTRFICKGGYRHEYGVYTKEHGYDSLHKAELEVKAAQRFYKESCCKTEGDFWKHYIER